MRPAPSVPPDALVVAAVVGTVNALLWSVLVVAVRASWDRDDGSSAVGLLALGAVNFVLGVVLVAACLYVGLPSRRRHAQVLFAVALSAAIAVVRTPIGEVLAPLGFTPWELVWLTGIATVGYFMVASPAILVSTLVARRRAEREARLAEQERNRAATSALESEEAELRREVAEHLHGTVQNRLVIVSTGLDQLAAELDAETQPERAESLRAWARTVDAVRERDVRAISHQVFPIGLELGLSRAVAMLLERLPTSVSTSVRIGEGLREIDQELPLPDRLVVVSAIEEGLTNALKHGHATHVDLRLDYVDGAVRVVLDDDGTGLSTDPSPESGLVRHRARIAARGGRLDLTSREDAGTRLSMVIPAPRAFGEDRPGLLHDE